MNQSPAPTLSLSVAIPRLKAALRRLDFESYQMNCADYPIPLFAMQWHNHKYWTIPECFENYEDLLTILDANGEDIIAILEGRAR